MDFPLVYRQETCAGAVSMPKTDVNAANAKIRTEIERLELESRKMAAEITRNLMDDIKRHGSRRSRSNALAEWLPTVLAAVMGFGFLGAVILVVIAARREHLRWETFAKAHDCHIIEHRSGDIDATAAPIVSSKGSVSYAVGVTDTPDKTAYLCNDGVTYWR
jgi:hypothetical protein